MIESVLVIGIILLLISIALNIYSKPTLYAQRDAISGILYIVKIDGKSNIDKRPLEYIDYKNSIVIEL